MCLTPDSNRNRAVSRKHPRLPAKRDVEVCWLYTSYVSGRSRHSLATYASCQIVHRATFNIFIAQQLYIVAVYMLSPAANYTFMNDETVKHDVTRRQTFFTTWYGPILQVFFSPNIGCEIPTSAAINLCMKHNGLR